MQEADCDAVGDLLNQAIEHGVAHFGTERTSAQLVRDDWRGTRERYPWLIAQDDGHAFLGFAKAGVWKTRAAYNWTVEAGVYVCDHAQGKGVGRALYRRLFEILRAQGFRVVLAGVSVPNAASERLHESMGFARVGDIAPAGHKHGRWVSVRLYQLLLAPCDDRAPKQPVGVARAMETLSHTEDA